MKSVRKVCQRSERLRIVSSPAVGSGRTGQYVFQVRSDDLGHWVSCRRGDVVADANVRFGSWFDSWCEYLHLGH